MKKPLNFTPRYDESVTITAAQLEPLIASRLYDLRFHLIDRLIIETGDAQAQADTRSGAV